MKVLPTAVVLRSANVVDHLMREIAARARIPVIRSGAEGSHDQDAFAPADMKSFLEAFEITNERLSELGYDHWIVHHIGGIEKLKDGTLLMHARGEVDRLQSAYAPYDAMINDGRTAWNERSVGSHGYVIVRYPGKLSFEPGTLSVPIVLALTDTRPLVIIEGSEERIFVMNVGFETTALLTQLGENARAFDSAQHFVADNSKPGHRPIPLHKIFEILGIPVRD
jgi:hypothetical protein